MKLTQFEQSGFVLKTDSGYKLAIDIGSYTPIEKLTGISPDAMIISHLHGDHLSTPQIKTLSPKKLYLNEECIEVLREEALSSEIVRIKADEEVFIEEIKVKTFNVNHGPNITVVPRENFGFLFEIDGEKIYFAGDMFYPSGIDVSELEVDIALIPVGTFYTFGPEEALGFVKQFKKIGKVIPMHSQKTPETREEFIKLAVASDINTENFTL